MEIHGLVAEAMILANASVGKRIYEGYKDAAILRHHPPPSPAQFEKFVKAAESKVNAYSLLVCRRLISSRASRSIFHLTER